MKRNRLEGDSRIVNGELEVKKDDVWRKKRKRNKKKNVEGEKIGWI